MDWEMKGITVEIKTDDDSPGAVVAEFAAFDEIDKDGDLTKPGAFGTQHVLLGGYGHTSVGMFGAPTPPVGKGTISEDGSKAIFTGNFNLDMHAGSELYKSVKMSGPLQQWSYGFRITKESREVFPERPDPVRVLEKLAVFEVSPVMMGAGNDTRTRDIKSAEWSAMTLEVHSDTALATVSEFLKRLESLKELRAQDGRSLSGTNRTRLDDLTVSLKRLQEEIAKLLETGDPVDNTAAEAAFLRYSNSLAMFAGV